MSKVKLSDFPSLFLDIRGTNINYELHYLFDTFAGIFLRRLGFREILPGRLLLKDVILRTREGHVFYCPARTDVLLHLMPYYERRTRYILSTILKPGDVFIDVGAHVGRYTILGAYRVGPDGLVIAIEPSPLYKILEINVILNKLQNIVIYKKAVYHQRTKLSFYYNPQRTGIASLKKEWIKSER